MVSVAVFNNKGGVGKTTLLCNLAAYLARHNKLNVLVVDCDPQCNTTQLIMGEDFSSKFYWDEHDETTTTIHDVLLPIKDGDAGISFKFEALDRGRNRFGVDLVPGHPNLSFLEDKLSLAWSEVSAGELSGYRKTNWARSFCTTHGRSYDVILFDVGPSLGALNRSILLGCDRFITPMGTDIFSILGIRNISSWLGEAISTYVHGLKRCDEKSPGGLERFSIPRKPSIKEGFCGYTLNQYITKMKGGVRIATARYEEIQTKVPNEIGALIDRFGRPGLTIESAKLGDVPHLYSLIPLAQTRSTPIISLSSRDGIVGSQYRMVEDYTAILHGIADKFLANISVVDLEKGAV